MDQIRNLVNDYLRFEEDSTFRNEVKSLLDAGNDKELFERFYKSLSFGTAGMRGIIGGGTNRMNSYMVGKISQAIAIYLKKNFLAPSVAIAYDSRHYSKEFALQAARSLASKNVKTYLYDTLHPVPMLSFAVKELKTSAGIVITSSHNPAKYNGYKVYGPNGAQIVSPADKEITEIYNSISKLDETLSEKKLRGLGVLQSMPSDIDVKYYNTVLSSIRRPEILKKSDMKVVYTPLFGTGNIPVRHILSKLGFDCSVVKEQELPNGDFPNLDMPNPEHPQAMELALEVGKKEKAQMVIGTDPDADRLGLAIATDDKCTDYTLLKGNQICTLFTDYLLATYNEQHPNKKKTPLVIKSIVTTTLLDRLCDYYGAKIETCLTGFKNIANVMERYKKDDKYEFLFGCEESFGFLSIPQVYDKDAVSSAALASEILCYYKSKGITVAQRFEQIAKEFGKTDEITISRLFEGSEGMSIMNKIMHDLREIKVGTVLDGRKIVKVTDLEKDPLPHSEPSNVVIFDFANGEKLVVRPSGTEPKVKYYFFFKADCSMGNDAFKSYCNDSKDNILKELP